MGDLFLGPKARLCRDWRSRAGSPTSLVQMDVMYDLLTNTSALLAMLSPSRFYVFLRVKEPKDTRKFHGDWENPELIIKHSRGVRVSQSSNSS
ncbi:hypothetical protein CEXT_704321 [Caerostris extrusa]|uniref:Uncharacterized protein n=1 Tax=Caerostris extrusa TaxID=172846 RepID=A0AAV4Q8G2_CAEEX|nr:hypothetical protein CEXT_704321 [Caerostris extrusa]